MIQKIVIGCLVLLCVGNMIMQGQTLELSKQAAKYEQDTKKISEEISDLEATMVKNSGVDTISSMARAMQLTKSTSITYIDPVVYAYNK